MSQFSFLVVSCWVTFSQEPAKTYQNQNGKAVYQAATRQQTDTEFSAASLQCPTKFRPGFRYVDPSNGQGSSVTLLRWEKCRWLCLNRVRIGQELLPIEHWTEEATIEKMTNPNRNKPRTN